MRLTIQLKSIFLLLCVLSGCGGGGGGASNSSSPVNAAPKNIQRVQSPSLPIYVAGVTFKAKGSGGTLWSATYSSTAAGTSMFNQQVAYATAVSFTVSQGATVVDGESVTEFALMNPFSPLGSAVGFSGLPGRLSIRNVTSYTPLPSVLSVGDSGTLLSGSTNNCCAFSESYTVTEGSPTAVNLNIQRNFPDFGIEHGEASLTGLYSGSSTMTYAVTDSGVATLIKILVTINGNTLTFQ